MRSHGIARWMVVIPLTLVLAWPVQAAGRLGGGADVGFGACRMPARGNDMVLAGSYAFHANLTHSRTLRACLEFRRTGGTDNGTRFPEAASAGQQSLTTVIVGEQWSPWQWVGGPFLFLGSGYGEAHLNRASGGVVPPGVLLRVPERTDRGPAVELALGFRMFAGPGPLHTQVGIRRQQVIAARRWHTAGVATLFTVAFAN